MRIGIDVTWAARQGTGTASYTRGLVTALVEHDEHQFVLYFAPGNGRTNPLWCVERANVFRRVVGGVGQPGRSLLALARAAQTDRLDVFHSPGYFLPLWTGPTVATFHDANALLHFSNRWRPGNRIPTLSLVGQSFLASRLARRIITDSHSAARDIARVYRVQPGRLTVVYPGIDERFFAPQTNEAAARSREACGLNRYFLAVGEIAPHKNIIGILRALARLHDRAVQLAVVGPSSGAYLAGEVRPEIDRLGLKERVRLLGSVADDVLIGLYDGAEALVFASYGEGFGLPAAEAMARGRPVIVSNRTSLPEVVGDAALLVDPSDVDEIAGAMERMLDEPDLRRRLATSGRERAGLFRWERAAAEVLRVYQEVAA